VGAEEKPWFGKRCARCDSPLNYAQAAKALVPGLCGKCVDEVRREIKRELVNEGAVVISGRGGGAGGAGKLFVGIVVGLLLGIAGAVACAAFAPDAWSRAVGAVAPAAPPKKG
jgi:hypothetical protein